jgi:hypothetical protein
MRPFLSRGLAVPLFATESEGIEENGIDQSFYAAFSPYRHSAAKRFDGVRG